MLKYLVIPLASDAVSFCHYSVPNHTPVTIEADTLKSALLWAMKENVQVQFLYPTHEVPEEIKDIIDTVDHTSIVPIGIEDKSLLDSADVIVIDDWNAIEAYPLVDGNYVVRTAMADLLENLARLKDIMAKAKRVNVMIADVECVTEDILNDYKIFLDTLIPVVIEQYAAGHQVQLNLLSDRLMLEAMNNCNAGDETLTLGPDGKFYVCPAFYHDGGKDVGDFHNGIEIRNPQLYRLSHAPICRSCDAWQCKRCVWLNKKLTREVNTPSHEQCVMAHLERNASKRLLDAFRAVSPSYMKNVIIEETDCLDPFDKLKDK